MTIDRASGWMSNPMGSGHRLSPKGKWMLRRIWDTQAHRQVHFSEEPPKEWASADTASP